MDYGPLVTEQIDDGARLAQAFDRVRPLRAAFWFKDADGGGWRLYLVSDLIDDTNFDVAYREVLDLFGPGPHLWLDPFQVKVAGPDDPVAKAVIAFQEDIERRYPGQLPTRLRNRRFGGAYAEEIYIYPIPVPAAGS